VHKAGPPEIIYRYANSPRQAWLLMCNVISREQMVPVNVVIQNYHFEDKEKVNIELEIEFEEKEDEQTNSEE